MFRTRQAPSPTGYLHFGTARTMLYTQLIAKKNQGIWYLRLEDTDRIRLNKDAVGTLLQSMEALALIPNEGVNSKKGHQDDFYNVYQEGDYGPYIQSERLAIYHKYAQKLLDKKLAYWSYITPENKEELNNIKQITKKPINYYQANIQLLSGKPLTESSSMSNTEIDNILYQSLENGLKDSKKPDLRFKVNSDKIIEVEDQLLGKSKFDLNLEEDFTCIKNDGYPTYHFAHPIDDHLMQTSLVIRAQEWLSSVPKHYKLFEALGFEIPKYLHLPVILSEVGNKKMSKREGNVNIQDYLNAGYLPEAIINYLTFLGFNPGNDKELYLTKEDFVIDSKIPIEEQRAKRMVNLYENILQDFDISKLQKSPARFSLAKLDWFNSEYIKMLSPYEYYYLVSKNQLLKKDNREDSTYRVGDYAYIVDFEKQELFGGHKNTPLGTDGMDWLFYPMGGGRGIDEDGKTSLIRELREESNNAINIESNQLIEAVQINMPLRKLWNTKRGMFVGKTMNIYVVSVAKSEIVPSVNNENYTRSYSNTWDSLQEVIENSKYFNFGLYQEFCLQNNFPIFLPSDNIKYNILAMVLDIYRVTKLEDPRVDSDMINDYSLKDNSIITWKKITYEESIANLQEFYPFIKSVLEKYEGPKKELLNYLYSNEIYNKYESLYEMIGIEIKNWLKENNKDTGSYLWPLRTTLSGQAKSASPFELLALIESQEIIRRIELVIYSK